MLDSIKKFLNHERYQVVAVLIVIFVVLFFQACESTCKSVLNPGTKINRAELQAEYELYKTQFESRLSELDKQDELKSLLSEQAILFTSTGSINPVGLMASVFAILGVGATVDNIRRRKSEKEST